MHSQARQSKWSMLCTNLKRRWGKLMGDDIDQLHFLEQRYDFDEEKASEPVEKTGYTRH